MVVVDNAGRITPWSDTNGRLHEKIITIATGQLGKLNLMVTCSRWHRVHTPGMWIIR